MNKEELKQYIDDNIYENQDGEITGESLNAVLKAIVDDGGTEVEANPEGDATTPLNKIKIGETTYKTDNPFVGKVQATDAERLQALANISNQEAGYDSSDPPAFTGKMGYVVLQPEKAGDATTTFAAQIANKPNTIFEIRDVFDLQDSLVTIPSNSTLNFNGGKIENGTLNLNGCTLEGNVMITSEPAWNEQNEFYEDYKPKNLELKVSWFGAKGDGVTDDAPAIQRAIKWLHKKGSTIIFDKSATYILGDGIQDLTNDPNMVLHTGYSYPTDYPMFTNVWTGISDKSAYLREHPTNLGRNIALDFFKFTELTIIGNGSTLKSHDNNGYTKNNRILYLWNCKNCTINDLTIDANREGRMELYQNPYWSDVTYGPGFYSNVSLLPADSLYDMFNEEVTWEDITLPRLIFAGTRQVYSVSICACEDMVFNNFSSINGLVDGMVITNALDRNIIIRKSYIAHNQRYGIWLGCCSDVMIENCTFEYAGYKLDNETVMGMFGSNSKGTHIDLENESTIPSVDNVITNCVFKKAGGNGIVISRLFENTKILHSTFDSSSIFSYARKGCFKNEIAYCKFNGNLILDAVHQEGMNFHHNEINILILDVDTHNIINYSTTYSNTWIKGTYSGTDPQYNSIVPSYFCDNVLTLDYAENIRNTSCKFNITDNIVMRNNVFMNFDFINTGSGSFIVKAREFVDNIFIYETDKYPDITNNIYKLSASCYSNNENCIIKNYYVNRVGTDSTITKGISTFNIRTNYAEASRYLIIKYVVSGMEINIRTSGVTTTSPQIDRTYYIHAGSSIIGSNDNCCYYIDKYTPSSSNYGGLRTNFSVIELDLKMCLSGQALVVTITYPFLPTIRNEAFYTYQSSQYAFTGTPDVAKNMTPYQDVLPTLAISSRAQFNGTTVFAADINKLCIKKDGVFVDFNGYTPALSKGDTASRPTNLTANDFGFEYTDSDLGKKIMWSGTSWVNLDGTALS